MKGRTAKAAELARVAPATAGFQLPTIIVDVGETARRHFVEFFTANIS